jgi:hypothetical protein
VKCVTEANHKLTYKIHTNFSFWTVITNLNLDYNIEVHETCTLL